MLVQVLTGVVEVARIELDEDVDIEHYADVPVIGMERVEVQLIEVAAAACGRGIGTWVVKVLALRHRDRRLLCV